MPYPFFFLRENGFRLRLITLLSALCLLAAPFLCPLPAAAADLTITGGRGGMNDNANQCGGGGQGGYVNDDTFWAAGGGGGASFTTTPNLDGLPGNAGNASGGGQGGNTGGAGGNTGSGGDGGSAANSAGINIPGNTHSGSTGGNGAGFDNQTYAGGTYTAQGGAGAVQNASGGGKGGDAAVTLTAPQVTYGSVNVTSGALGQGMGGASGGAAGGAASLTANTLIAPTINLVKKDGALAFTVTTLDVTTGSTVLTLDGTTAAGVNISNVTLDGGNTFAVTSANGGAGTFTNLNVTGAGGTLTAPAAQLFGSVNLAGGSSLTSTNALNFSTMRVQGQGAGYTGALNAAGKSLIFELPASLTTGQTMLNVTGNADLTGTNIGLVYQTVRPSIAEGEKLILLNATSLTADQTGLTVQTAGGDIYTLLVENNQLLAMLGVLSPNTPAYERLKAYAEGRTASLAFVNQGADLILNQGMGSALMSTSGPGFKFAPFAAGSGGWSRYNTGSHVDVSGASMLAGLAIGNDAGPGRLTAGLFFEGGWGNYNSYNSFGNYASVDGDGDTNYYGGGILGRYDVTSGALSGLYFDASARMGRASTDFSSGDIRYHGSKADFDSDSMYWGAHAGLGYQWSFTEKAMLDLSGKFIWTRQDGDNVNVHGDRVRFDSADSLRTRLGGRFNYAVCDYATPYVGAYWEHEFDGKQRSTINGVGTGSPDLKGDTGMGELGLTIKPVKDSGFSMDLGVQGYTGVREGVTGSLQLKFEF